jgi:hypothetical protein
MQPPLRVNGSLQRGRIVRHAVADCTEIVYVG